MLTLRVLRISSVSAAKHLGTNDFLGNTWQRAHIALWNGSVLLSFRDQNAYNKWQGIGDRNLGKAGVVIDLENAIRVSSDVDINTIDITTFDGQTLLL